MLHTYQKPLSGKKVGVVFGSFAPLHQGHLDLIMRAKKENDGGCLVIVCGYEGDKGEPLMPHSKRYRYVREFFADDDLVAVYAINDTESMRPEYPNGWDSWMNEFNDIWEKATITRPYSPHGYVRFSKPERVWYVGDENYYNDLVNKQHETAILVDRTVDNPISATMIRQNPIKHWDKIATPFRRIFSHNILITGTASEGKSTLVTDLGKYFNAPHSFEWAKDEYMKNSDISEWELDGADFIAFLHGQYDLNKQLINSPANHGVFFADTDAIVTKMYAEYYSKDKDFALTEDEYKKIAIVADELASKSHWDKIFLIAPHGVFVDDHMRYMGHGDMEDRKKLFDILCADIKWAGDWDNVTILNGNYYENFCAVVDYVKSVIDKQ